MDCRSWEHVTGLRSQFRYAMKAGGRKLSGFLSSSLSNSKRACHPERARTRERGTPSVRQSKLDQRLAEMRSDLETRLIRWMFGFSSSLAQTRNIDLPRIPGRHRPVDHRRRQPSLLGDLGQASLFDRI